MSFASDNREALSVDLPKGDLSVKGQCCGNGSTTDLNPKQKKARIKALQRKDREGNLSFEELGELTSLLPVGELSRQRIDRRRRAAQRLLSGHAPVDRPFDTNDDRQLESVRRGKWYPVTACAIVPLDVGLALEQRASGKVDRLGVFRCGSAWTCPSCQQRIAVPRAKQIRDVQLGAREHGCVTAMFSFTMPHDKATPLEVGMQRLKDAWRHVRQDWIWRTRLDELRYAGHVHSTEVTLSLAPDPDDPNTLFDNGWHVHGHAMYVFEATVDGSGRDDATWALNVKCDLFPAWHRACLKAGAPRAPSFERGLDVRVAWSATDYIQKLDEPARPKAQSDADAGKRRWGIEAELTKSYMKEGRKKSRTPFELLDSDDPRDHELFREYARGTFGRSQIEWSRGRFDLRKRFLGEDYSDLSDEDAAAAEPDWEFADDHVKPDADVVVERADIAADDCWRARRLGRNALDRACSSVDGGGALSLEVALREQGFVIDGVSGGYFEEEPIVDADGNFVWDIVVEQFGPGRDDWELRTQRRTHLVYRPRQFHARYPSKDRGGFNE